MRTKPPLWRRRAFWVLVVLLLAFAVVLPFTFRMTPLWEWAFYREIRSKQICRGVELVLIEKRASWIPGPEAITRIESDAGRLLYRVPERRVSWLAIDDELIICDHEGNIVLELDVNELDRTPPR